MPPVKMTRAEYEKQYGSPATSTAPVKMTRSQYEQTYGGSPKRPALTDFAIGAGKSVLNNLEAPGRLLGKITTDPLNRAIDRQAGTDTQLGLPEKLTTPTNTTQKVGGVTADIASFALPSTLPLKIAKGMLTTPRKMTATLEAAGRVVQGDERAAEVAEKVLRAIDTKGVKTYKDLAKRLSDRATKNTKFVDDEFDAIPDAVKLNKLTQKLGDKPGASINYVDGALRQLSELYGKTLDLPEKLRVDQMLQKARKDGLTPSEINKIAREYGKEFKAKGFDKLGQQLTSINDKAYENTRKGIKNTARSFLKTDEAKLADEETSDVLKVLKQVASMSDKVLKLEQRVKPRGLGTQIGRLAGQGLDLATGGVVKGAFGHFFPSNIGLKTMNSLDIEKELPKLLKQLRN